MSYWIREIVGWLLVVLGLFVFLMVYDYCERRWIFEAAILAIVGIFIFRGGILLLKVAIAARVCRQTQDNLYPARGMDANPQPAVSARRTMTEP